MSQEVFYLSTLLPRQYPSDAETLFTALAAHDVPYALLDGTRDIWLRDFMPVRTGSGKLVSFRYEPSYLKNDPDLRTDGMARFLDDRTVLCNRPLSSCGFEQQVKRAVQDCGLDAVDFPFVPTGRVSAVGCYLNYLETERVVFLPVFGIEQDAEAETFARQLFSKEIVPVNIREIARQGGCLNCISWEGPHA